MNIKKRETILVVDDVPENIDILVHILTPEYRVTFAANGQDALVTAQASPRPDLILLDVMMPDMDGYEICRRLKADLRTNDIPIIFLTARADANDEEHGLKLGAVDFLTKPSHPAIVLQRVRNHLGLYNQSLSLENKVIERTLERAAEYRDNETGNHVVRMSKFCYQLALASGVSESQAVLLQLAAPMHDIGKIGIPDHILLKPGRHDDEERAIMQRHAAIGGEIIGKHESPLLALARTVALTHHERWDGKGYPNGLSGEEIPLEGRITAICDVYDALTSNRPYKRAWPIDEAIDYILSESGKAFDPRLTAIFVEILPMIKKVGANYVD